MKFSGIYRLARPMVPLAARLGERSVGAESSRRRCRDAGREVHHATRGVERRTVGGRDGVVGAGLDRIVVGVAVVDERNIANTEAAADHGVRRSAVGDAEARRHVACSRSACRGWRGCHLHRRARVDCWPGCSSQSHRPGVALPADTARSVRRDRRSAWTWPATCLTRRRRATSAGSGEGAVGVLADLVRDVEKHAGDVVGLTGVPLKRPRG